MATGCQPIRYTMDVSYEDVIDDVARIVEVSGVAIMVLGGLVALVRGALAWLRPGQRARAYVQTRQNLGRAILLGLEVLIIGDIVRTIVVDPTIESVTVLGLIVLIRIVLSFSIEVEMDGTWPWSRWRQLPRTDSGEATTPGP
ncbi:MAG TPA: DUF1622 domain-containing protein [Acidimicrobiales bacterium]